MEVILFETNKKRNEIARKYRSGDALLDQGGSPGALPAGEYFCTGEKSASVPPAIP